MESMERDRSTYLGSTDIGAIAGVDPHRTAIDVYLQKTGMADPVVVTEPMEWGLRLERVVAEKWAEVRGYQLVKGQFVPGPKPFLGGTPDYLADGHRLGMDSKTAGFFQREDWGEEGTDSVPDQYVLQMQWLMALTGFQRWEIAVLIAGQGFRIYKFDADRELQGYLIDLATDWWERHIVRQEPPTIDGSDSAREYLAKKFPRHVRPLLRSTPEVDAIAEQLRAVRADKWHIESKEAELVNALKAIIGDAEGIEGPTYRITWRAAKDSQRVDLETLRADPDAAEIVRKHTRTVAGSRRFLANFKEP